MGPASRVGVGFLFWVAEIVWSGNNDHVDNARPAWWTPWVNQPQRAIPRVVPEQGSILFECRWHKAPSTSGPHMRELMMWREQLYKLDLVGVNEQGVGFGNLSCRVPDYDPFFIGRNTLVKTTTFRWRL